MGHETGQSGASHLAKTQATYLPNWFCTRSSESLITCGARRLRAVVTVAEKADACLRKELLRRSEIGRLFEQSAEDSAAEDVASNLGPTGCTAQV